MGLFLGLLIAVFSLNLLRNSLNQHVYHSLFVATKSHQTATLLFALLFLPGVALHELSHWVMAKLLFVKTHRFSLIPAWTGEGEIRFGFVEISKTDGIRSALIAIAPLVSGIVAILWLAFTHLHLDILLEGITNLDSSIVSDGIKIYLQTPDVLLWSYLLLAISNTMLPSASDRKAWLPAGIIFLLIYAILVGLNFGSDTGQYLVDLARRLAQTLLRAFSIAVILNLLLLIPFWILERILKREGR